MVVASVTITLSMRTVGLLLISALMVIPVATSQQLFTGFRTTLRGAMGLGVVAALGGTVGSSFLGHCQRSYPSSCPLSICWGSPPLELPGPGRRPGNHPTTQDLPDSDRILGITAIPVLVQVGLLSIWHDGPPSQVVGENSPACIARRIFMTSISTRNTWQRAAVRALLANTEEFRTAAQIHSELRQVGDKIGLATVYRALQTMSESGDLDVLRTPDGEAAYRMCSNTHHHHLVCRSCGIAVEISADAVESWASQVAGEHGFTDAGHNLEIFGLCRNCSPT